MDPVQPTGKGLHGAMQLEAGQRKAYLSPMTRAMAGILALAVLPRTLAAQDAVRNGWVVVGVVLTAAVPPSGISLGRVRKPKSALRFGACNRVI